MAPDPATLRPMPARGRDHDRSSGDSMRPTPAHAPSPDRAADARRLHLAVSNQSPATPAADVAVTIDGREVLARAMESRGGHAWHELTVAVAPGRRTVAAVEAGSGARATREVDVDRDLWIALIFFAPPPRFVVEVSDGPIGLA